MDPRNQLPNNTLAQQPKFLKQAIGAVVAIVLICVFAYAATHGRLVTGEGADGQYTLQKDTGDPAVKITNIKKGTATLGSGKYIIRYSDGGTESIRYIEVPTFLRSVRATFASVKQRQVDKVAIKTLDHIAASPNNTITSVNALQQIGTTFIHPYGDPTGHAKAVGNIFIGSNENFMHNNHFVGFTPTNDEGKKQVQRYGLMSQKNETLPKKYPDASATHLIVPATAQTDLFGVSYAKDSATSIDVYKGAEIAHTLNGLENIALGNQGNAVVALSENYAAIGYGDDYTLEADENPSRDGKTPTANEYVIKVYELATGKVAKELKLGKTMLVGSVQINNDASYLSINENNKIIIYDLSTSKPVFSYDTPAVINPQWLNNSELLFGTTAKGVYKLNAKERSATTLFQSSLMNLSEFDVYDNKIFFTAFSKDAGASSSVADGYIAYLNQEASNANQLLRVPLGKSSQIKFQTLNNIIYAVPNSLNIGGSANADYRVVDPDPVFKEQVSSYLKANLPNWEQYQIVYGNHF